MDEREQLRLLSARLEQTWRESGTADLTSLLPASGSPLRLPCLHALIQRELEIRYRLGQPLTLEQYRQRFPELGPPGSLPSWLVYEEFRARQQFGDRPGLESYRTRFPEQFRELLTLAGQAGLIADAPPTAHVQPRTGGPVRETQTAPMTALPASLPRTPSLPPSTLEVTSRTISGGYRLHQRIGRGQFGEVFRALAPGDIEVAVKCLSQRMDDATAQYELDALELIRSLRHPFLLQTQAFWIEDDRLHIVMELAEESLHDWFRRCQKEQGLPGIPAEELVTYLGEAAEGLDYLHSRNVLHRDIKPANLLSLGGHAKVADFGLARLLEAHLAQATLCGTPQYMAPEVFRGMLSVHSDQYSLAVTYAEMRLGHPPYYAKNPFELSRMHQEDSPNLEGMSEAEQQVVAQALNKDPEKRFPSCKAFVRALATALAPAPPPPLPPPPPPRRALWGILTALVVGLSLGGMAMLYFFYGPTPNGEPKTPEIWKPEGFEVPAGVETIKGPGDKLLSRSLVCPVQGASPLTFLLIERKRSGDPPTFYVTRDPVTAEQFRAALQSPRMRELLAEFAKKAPRTVRPIEEIDPGKGALPATKITVNEAHCFAQSLDEGCRLPRAREWDKAGGRFDGAKGPFKPGWKEGEIALGELRPVGTSPADVSLFGCRDMAGNGREFTSDLSMPVERTVPFFDPEGGMVILRGPNPVSGEPFVFASLALSAPSMEYNMPRSDVGFRVVLELPIER